MIVKTGDDPDTREERESAKLLNFPGKSERVK